jgi:HlyD family secretion protein
VIQQSVTMFPVIISLPNSERLLLPGMNGEVSVNVEKKLNVIAVPNDAVRGVREAAASAEMLGLDPEAVTAMLRGGGPPGAATAAAADSTQGRRVPVGGADSAARVVQGAAAGGAPAAGGRPTGGRPTGMPASAMPRTGGGLAARRNPTPARQAVVFVVSDSGTYEPRMVRLGISDFDFSEVISGLQEGEMVASLAMAALQAAREQRNARFSGMGGVPGLSRTTPSTGGGRGGR